MVFLETAGLFLLVILVAGVCGFGVVNLLLPDEYREEFAFLIMPPIGYGFFSWIAFTLSGALQIPGRAAILAALVAVCVLALIALVSRPPTWPMVRGSLPTLTVSLLATGCALWPLFYVGAATFLGAVNPDYTATFFDIHFLRKSPLVASVPYSVESYSYFESVAGRIATSARFGSSYFVLLVWELFRIPPRTALTVCIGVFISCLPSSLYFLARTAFGLSRRTALLAAVLVLVAAPVSMSYVYFYVGQNSGMGVLPLVLALLYLAVTRPSGKLVLLATLVVNSLYIMYTAMVPYAAGPVGAAALYLVATRRLPLGRLVKVGAAMAALSVALNAANFSFLGTALRGWNRLVSKSLQGQFFTDFLTEQFVPIFTGVVPYPMKTSVYAPILTGRFRAVLFLFAGVTLLTVLGAALHWARRRPDKGQVALAFAAMAIYGVVWYVYTFRRQYGYAVFKMSSWIQFLYVLPLAYGLGHALAWSRRQSGWHRRAGRTAFAVLVLAVAANAVSTTHLTRLSLGHDTERGMIVNLYDMSGNYDYLKLADRVGEWVKPGESVGLSFVDSIQNQWVSYYLQDFRTSFLSHYLIPADDENLPEILFRRVTDYYGNVSLDLNHYFHGATDDYYLTWSDRHINRDIVERRLPKPLWEDRTFRLVRASECPAFIYTGRGWYRLEFRQHWQWWWPDRFRWTAEGGEIYMLRGRAGQPYRLSFYGLVGHGAATDSRHIELWHNTQKFDEIAVTAAGRVVSQPFYSTGEVDRLVIKVQERVRPLPRPFPLWNRSIPEDYRRLNLLVAGVKVLPPEELVPEPARYALRGEALFNESYTFDGLEPNRWAGRSMRMALKRPGWARNLALSVFIPGHPDFRFPFPIEVVVDGVRHVLVATDPGHFTRIVPLGAPSPDGLVRLQTLSSQVYMPDGADMKNHPTYHSFQVQLIGLTP